MKKIIALLLVVFIGLTFAGCENSKNLLANNIQTNVNKLSSLLEKTKELSDDDIIMKELQTTDNQKLQTNENQNTVENQETNTNNEINSEINKEETKTNRVNHIKKYDYPRIEKMPKPNANTQIVKDGTQSVSAQNKFEKVANKSVENSISPTRKPPRRLTNGEYVPKRISTADYNNSGLTNYFSKIEDLYLMMNDACSANKDCGCLKSCILENCDMLSELCKQLKKKQIQLNKEQVQTCNDCLSKLNKYTNNLNNTRNDVQTSCNAVKTMNINPSAKIEQISSKYVKLINCLDERISCYSNILSILTQLRCTITGVCENDNINEALKIEKNIEENIEENKKENFPQILPMPIENDENKIVINEENTENNEKINENSQKNQENSIKNVENNKLEEKTKKINDFGNKNLNVQDLPKHNLDTFKEQTIKPNIGFGLNNRPNNNNQNQDYKEQIVDENKNDSNNNNENANNETKNNQQPNTENINQTNNLPNNANTMNNGMYGNPAGINGIGVAPGVGINGMPNGIGYNNNVISNGYGYHNYENGITNPYRNTDTYKLPVGNGVNNGAYGNGYVYGNGGIANPIARIKPLESETRKDFKPFAKIA